MAKDEASGTQASSFDPRTHLIKTKGNKLYLPVAARILWMTTDREEGGYEITIISEVVHYSEDRAVVKSTVTIPGRGTATGIKSETKSGFPGNYLEKSATGSIGRALSLLGYGTEYALELFEEDVQEGGEVSQAVDTPRAGVVTPTSAGGITMVARASAALEQAAGSPEQRKVRANQEIKRLAREHGYSPPSNYGALLKLAAEQYGYNLPKVRGAAEIAPQVLEAFVAHMKQVGGDPGASDDDRAGGAGAAGATTAGTPTPQEGQPGPFEQAPHEGDDAARTARYAGAVSDLRRALEAYSVPAQLDDVIALVHQLHTQGCLHDQDRDALDELHRQRVRAVTQAQSA